MKKWMLQPVRHCAGGELMRCNTENPPPDRQFRGRREKEAEQMTETPAAEYRRQGCEAGKDELRRLLRKVPEQQQLAVVHAWLLETTEEIDD